MNATMLLNDPFRLFADYIAVMGVAHLGPEPRGAPALLGKRLGLLNGASWIALWCNYIGRLYLPGVHLINAGSNAVQINFMRAYAAGEPCPPQSSVDVFVHTARDLVQLADVVEVPVVQIDMPMMEAAVNRGGKVLVIAMHGSTVESTQALLAEIAARLGVAVAYTGITVEQAWQRLAVGDVRGHNGLLAAAIRETQVRETLGSVVLAQLSMSVFAFDYPDAEAVFGVLVFTSAQMGFRRVREVLTAQSPEF